MFHERFKIDVQTESEVTGIDRSACTIAVRNRRSGRTGTERQALLVLCLARRRFGGLAIVLPGGATKFAILTIFLAN